MNKITQPTSCQWSKWARNGQFWACRDCYCYLIWFLAHTKRNCNGKNRMLDPQKANAQLSRDEKGGIHIVALVWCNEVQGKVSCQEWPLFCGINRDAATLPILALSYVKIKDLFLSITTGIWGRYLLKYPNALLNITVENCKMSLVR